MRPGRLPTRHRARLPEFSFSLRRHRAALPNELYRRARAPKAPLSCRRQTIATGPIEVRVREVEIANAVAFRPRSWSRCVLFALARWGSSRSVAKAERRGTSV